MALLSYAVGVSAGTQWGRAIPMAFHTSFAFILTGVSVLAWLIQRGLFQWYLSRRLSIILSSGIAAIILVATIRWAEVNNLSATILVDSVRVIDVLPSPVPLTNYPLFLMPIGELLSLLVIGIILQQLNAEAGRRHHSEDRFRSLLHNVPNVAVQGYVEDGTVNYWNKASESFYGYTAEEAMGRNLLDLIIPPEMKEDVREAMTSCFRHNTHIPPGELTLRRKDGSPITVYSSHAMLRLKDAQPEMFCIDVDLTERKNLEQQFLRTQRLESIGTMAAGIAHDLNNLLAPIVVAVGVLKRMDSDGKYAAIIQNIERSAQRGSNLIQQVLSFASGKPGEKCRVNPQLILHDVELLTRSSFPKNIHLSYHTAEDLWPFKADITQLHQVLINLCVNARDAMPDGGTITISCYNDDSSHTGRFVVISVQDSGIGMAEAVMDRVFEPFFTTKETGKGTGLGLSTALNIIQSHGGFINVYSEPGKGSEFRVFLPAERT